MNLGNNKEKENLPSSPVLLRERGGELALGLILLLVGFLSFWGTQTQSLYPQNWHPSLIPMSFLVSLGFFLVGFEILLLRKTPSFIQNSFWLLFVFIGLGGIIFGVFLKGSLSSYIHGFAPPIFGEGFNFYTPMGVSISLILLGFSRSLKTKPFGGRFLTNLPLLLPFIVFLFSLVALAGHAFDLTPISPPIRNIRMGAHTAFFFMALAIRDFRFFLRINRWENPNRVPLLFFLVGLSLTIGIWTFFEKGEKARLSEWIQSVAKKDLAIINGELHHNIIALENLRVHWALNGPPEKKEWQQRAQIIERVMPAFQALEWADPQGLIRWVEPLPGNEPAMGLDLTLEKKRKQTLVNARALGTPLFSQPVNLMQGGKGVLLISPLSYKNNFQGYMVGVIHMEMLLGGLLQTTISEGYSIRVFAGGEEVYSRISPKNTNLEYWAETSELEIYGIKWAVTLWPSEKEIVIKRNNHPQFVMIMGVVFSLLLALVAHMAQVAFLRAKEAEGAVGIQKKEEEKRKELEEAFQESEQRFLNLAEGSLQGVVVHRDFKQLYVNNALVEMFGYDSPEEVLAQEDQLALLAPHEWERMRGFYRDRMEGKPTPTMFEIESLRKDGTHFWVLNLSRPVVWDGKPAVQSSYFDITERKKTEAALAESEFYLAHAQEMVNLGSAVRDLKKGTLKWSEQVYRILGYEVYDKEPHRDLFYEHVPENEREKIRNAVDKAIGKNQPFRMEHSIKTKDGIEKIVLHLGEVHVGANGLPEKYVATLLDITERKHIEQELREIKEKLEVRVEERTHELKEEIEVRRMAEEELVKTQQTLLEKEKMATLGQLTATVNHELRNPMGTIRSSAFLLKETLAGKGLGVERVLDRIERNVERCDRIIEELLDYTRTRDLDLFPGEVDDWVKNAMAEMTLPDWLELELKLEGKGTTVMLDRERMRRVLINLVDNATQAMEEAMKKGLMEGRTPKLTLTARTKKDRAELKISDNGPGIGEKEKDLIFKPLFSTKGFGVGLGLPTVKHILEKHRGDITIKNNPKYGCHALIWLPLAP